MASFSYGTSSDCFFCDTTKCRYCLSSSEMGFLIFVAKTTFLGNIFISFQPEGVLLYKDVFIPFQAT